MFEYVIIGAGSAGCVLAHRLVRAGYRVALLEAGGPDRRTEIKIPAAFTKLFNSECDWAYRTEKQAALGGRELFTPRGKVLGGCSSMNAQMWLPGCPADYDGWADSGNSGWDWKAMSPYLDRAERRTHEGGAVSGGIRIEPLRDPNPSTLAFLRACEQAGLPKFAASRPEGYGATPVTQHGGRRFSAVDGYLRPVLGESNLSVITGARARKILFEGRRAVGVQFDSSAGRQELRASREVLVASGAIESPKLLMLSGIGERALLSNHGIPLVRDLPGVGRNLQDHVMTVLVASCPKPVTLVNAESIGNLLRYLVRKKGPLTSNVAEAFAFLRTRPELREPDVELIFAPVPFIDHGLVKPPGHGISLGVVLLQPESRGRVTLRSDDVNDKPRIDPAYLSDPAQSDLRALVAGLKRAQGILNSQALSDYVGAPIEPARWTQDDAELAAFVRDQAETLYHPVGTCRMGDDDGAVVDASLRVHGTSGLRVVDASVMPRIIRGHTHAPTTLIAEKAADMILADARASARATATHDVPYVAP